MRTNQTSYRGLLLAVLTIGLITAAASAAPPENRKDALFPGAKLVHKFPKTVYRVPVFVATDKGPCLEVWFDPFDPAPPPRPGPGGGRVPDPRPELLIWDPIANKQLHKLSYPKEPIAFPHVSPFLERDGGMAISPDGKRLASKTLTYTPRIGSPYGDHTTRIKLIDITSLKVQPGAEYKDEKAPGPTAVHLSFATDGALVTIRGSTCTMQEIDKAKPRVRFELKRAVFKNDYWSKIHDVVVSPDGSQLAIAADGTVIVYDLAKGKKLFEASRAAPEPKKGGELFTADVSLAYAPAGTSQLLAVESLTVGTPGFTVIGDRVDGKAAQKEFALARLFDLKNKKEEGKWRLAGPSGAVSAYYTAKGEPRFLCNGKVIDGANSKELHKFNPGVCTFASRDGKALVRVTKKKKEDKAMTVELWRLDTEK
jgi:WD40 repeat protein